MSFRPVSPINTIAKLSTTEQAVYDSTKNNIKKQETLPKDDKEIKVTREDAENLAEVMNRVSELFNHSLHFKLFEETDRLYVQIIDRETQEVIKQIPPQEMLELSAKIQEMVGIMFDKYV